MESETKEILNMLLEEFQNVKTEVKQNTAETRELRSETRELRNETRELRNETRELRSETCELRNETHELRGIIETEIRHNIRAIAEGHEMQTVNVNNYINAVENIRAKQELFEIRLSMLETEMKAMKRA